MPAFAPLAAYRTGVMHTNQGSVESKERYFPDTRFDLVGRLAELRGRPPLRPFFFAAFALASLRI
jgi:hypothetical protein